MSARIGRYVIEAYRGDRRVFRQFRGETRRQALDRYERACAACSHRVFLIELTTDDRCRFRDAEDIVADRAEGGQDDLASYAVPA